MKVKQLTRPNPPGPKPPEEPLISLLDLRGGDEPGVRILARDADGRPTSWGPAYRIAGDDPDD
jgi:hypothetical protein